MPGEYPQFNRADADAVFAEARKSSLATSQVLPFVASANPDNLRDLATWYGGGVRYVRPKKTPVELFSTALDAHFRELPPVDQERVLVNGLRFATLDMPRAVTKPKVTQGYYSGLWYNSHDVTPLFQAAIVHKNEGQSYIRNISIYLSTVLEYVGEDLSAAQALIRRAPYIGPEPTRVSVGLAVSFLYRSSNENENLADPKNREALREAKNIREAFQKRHPKNRALAFWIDTELGSFNIGGRNGDLNLEQVLREDDPALKTQVFAYLKEQLVTGGAGFDGRHALIGRVIRKNEQLYKVLKAKYPDAQFVREYEMIQRLLKLTSLERRTQGGKISLADLVTLLQAYPNLIDQVSIAELEAAISLSSDHGVIAKLEEALRLKRASALGQSLQI